MTTFEKTNDEGLHTPGPWKAVATAFGPIDIVIPDGRDIVTVYGGGTGNKEANARLIASAPELLEALKAIHRHIDDPAHYNRHIDVLCEAAIAKAEGRPTLSSEQNNAD